MTANLEKISAVLCRENFREPRLSRPETLSTLFNPSFAQFSLYNTSHSTMSASLRYDVYNFHIISQISFNSVCFLILFLIPMICTLSQLFSATGTIHTISLSRCPQLSPVHLLHLWLYSTLDVVSDPFVWMCAILAILIVDSSLSIILLLQMFGMTHLWLYGVYYENRWYLLIILNTPCLYSRYDLLADYRIFRIYFLGYRRRVNVPSLSLIF